MKNRNVVSSIRRKMLHTDRKLPLNTIVLPPLSALENGEVQIIHSILVNKPLSENTVTDELLSVHGPNDTKIFNNDTSNVSDSARVAQLEQNIRFLQDQHTHMLVGLHQEIDNLRLRNREMQFQLIFTKSGIPSTPSSPEDDSKSKTYLSPKQINVTPLQIEILEKELAELKLQLQETDSRNAYLSAIVEEQKKKLERYERDRERELERATQPDPELLRKLDDAETLIRRLRRENSELRVENSSTGGSSNSGNSTSYHRDNGSYQRGGSSQNRSNNGRHRGNSAGHYRGNWFPPLHGQTYWQGNRNAERNGGTNEDNTVLPIIANGGNSNGQYGGRRGANNNQYHNGESRKYKSGQNRGSKPPS